MKILLLLFILLYCNISIFSQNIECIGNKIQIPLSGYKYGNIQWQFSLDTKNWTNISGQTTTTLDIIVSETGYFRAKIKSSQCEYFSDTTFIQAFSAPIANAGLDQIITNLDTAISLSANIQPLGKGKWSIISGTGGIFENDTLASTIFRGKPCSDYVLRWTMSTNCANKTDDVNIRFYSKPTIANAGLDQTINNLDTIITLSANTPLIGKGKWSIISGVGSNFENDTLPFTKFNGKLCSDYILRWKIYTVCETSTDDVKIQFHLEPTTANAGDEQTSKKKDTIFTLTANQPIVGIGKWRIASGNGGTLIDSLKHNATFKGQEFTIYQLNWSISTKCKTSSDSTKIIILGNLYDIEGNAYKTINIGSQIWMAENLKTTKYNDGSEVPLVTSYNDWWHTTPAFGWYNNDPSTYKDSYGALYNWYSINPATNGNKNVCPVGWHVPTDTEWSTLIDYLGGEAIAGAKLKEIGTTHWISPNTGANNSSGFNALPGGNRWVDGSYNIGKNGFWWSSTENNPNGNSWTRIIYYDQGIVKKSAGDVLNGYSVRCLKNN